MIKTTKIVKEIIMMRQYAIIVEVMTMDYINVINQLIIIIYLMHYVLNVKKGDI